VGLDFGFLLIFPSRFLISGRRFQLISTDITTQCMYEISTVANPSAITLETADAAPFGFLFGPTHKSQTDQDD